MLRFFLALLCLQAAWAQPRLVASVQAPVDSMDVWVRGDRFGIQGMWSYNTDPVGRDWCWNGRDGSSYFPLPTPGLIEHVDAAALTALVEGDNQRWFLWKPGPGGNYQSRPAVKKRYHGSENFPLIQVYRPALGRVYQLDQHEVQIAESKSGRVLYRRVLNSPYTLALAGQTLAVADQDSVALLSSEDLKVVAQLPVGHVTGLAFDPGGKRLALLDHKSRIRVYLLASTFKCEGEVCQKLWNGHNLTPAVFRTLAQRWRAQTGTSWWAP